MDFRFSTLSCIVPYNFNLHANFTLFAHYIYSRLLPSFTLLFQCHAFSITGNGLKWIYVYEFIYLFLRCKCVLKSESDHITHVECNNFAHFFFSNGSLNTHTRSSSSGCASLSNGSIIFCFIFFSFSFIPSPPSAQITFLYRIYIWKNNNGKRKKNIILFEYIHILAKVEWARDKIKSIYLLYHTHPYPPNMHATNSTNFSVKHK